MYKRWKSGNETRACVFVCECMCVCMMREARNEKPTELHIIICCKDPSRPPYSVAESRGHLVIRPHQLAAWISPRSEDCMNERSSPSFSWASEGVSACALCCTLACASESITACMHKRLSVFVLSFSDKLVSYPDNHAYYT